MKGLWQRLTLSSTTGTADGEVVGEVGKAVQFSARTFMNEPDHPYIIICIVALIIICLYSTSILLLFGLKIAGLNDLDHSNVRLN